MFRPHHRIVLMRIAIDHQRQARSPPIPTEAELKHRRSRSALEVAHILANEYGHILEPTNYVRGVAMSGRLRLHALDDGYPDPSADLAAIVDPLLTDESFHTLSTSDGSKHAGFVWADELSETTGDPRYADFLLRFANLYLTARPDGFPEPVDPDYRVEDLFFVGAIIGRAVAVTGDRQIRRCNGLGLSESPRPTRHRSLLALQRLSLLLGARQRFRRTRIRRSTHHPSKRPRRP